jgi:hypothetical protein
VPNKTTYVIENEANLLYDGSLWTEEYPDAELFRTKKEAVKQANKLSWKFKESTLVIKNYGLDEQEATEIDCYENHR